MFTIYGHGSRFDQRTTPSLAIFLSPAPTRLHMKCSRGSFEILNIFPYKCIGKQTWPYRKKVKCQCTTIILATLVGLPSPMIHAKIQPYPRFWRRRFLKVFTIYWHGGHLGQWPATILAILHFPSQGRLQMKFE